MKKTETKKYPMRYQNREKLKEPTFEVHLNLTLISTLAYYHSTFKVIIKKISYSTLFV